MNSRTQVASKTAGTTTINHLHDEILILIMTSNAFRLYQPISTWNVHAPANRIPSHLQDTINASQVCHRWRIIALTSPELWSHMINMGHPRPEWTKLLLDRSEPLGITFMQTTRTVANNPFELEMRLNSRIDEYRVSMIPHQQSSPENARLLHTFSYYFKIWGDFPRLKALNIQFHGSQWLNDTKILRELFPYHAIPNLQYLYVRGIPIHCPGLKSLENLTILHISRPPLNNKLEVDSFLDILPDIPFLKDLSLVYALRKPTSNTSRHITLPLEKFVLYDCNVTFAQVIQSVAFQNQDLRYCELEVFGEEDDPTTYQYFTQLLPTLFQTTQQKIPTSWHQCNKFILMPNGFEIRLDNTSSASADMLSATRAFRFHLPPIMDMRRDRHHYFSLGKINSDLILTIILGLPTSVCAHIDTLVFSALPLDFPDLSPSEEGLETLDWLLAFFKSIFCIKLSHICHVFNVPWNWGRFMHTCILDLPTNRWENGIQSHLSDSDVLDIVSYHSDFYGITSYGPPYDKGSEDVTLDLDFSALKSNQNTGSDDPVTIEVALLDNHGTCHTTSIQIDDTTNTSDMSHHNQSTEYSDYDSQSAASEIWTTSYLLQPIDSDVESVGVWESSDTGSLYDPNLSPDDSSGSDFELDWTFYEELVKLCQEISTIRKIRGVPREDESMESDVWDLFEPHSMQYLEEELKILGVEVEFYST